MLPEVSQTNTQISAVSQSDKQVSAMSQAATQVCNVSQTSCPASMTQTMSSAPKVSQTTSTPAKVCQSPSTVQSTPVTTQVPSNPARTNLTPHHPAAHALLSVAQALLCPANAIAATLLPTRNTRTVQFTEPPTQNNKSSESEQSKLDPKTDSAFVDAPANLSVLPIDEVTMPTDDVSDLQDVFDAINRLCETMRTSTYEQQTDDTNETEPTPESAMVTETMPPSADIQWSDGLAVIDLVAEIRSQSDIVQTDESVASLIEGMVSPPSGSVQGSDILVEDMVAELTSPPSSSVRSSDAYRAEKWSDALVSPPSADEADAFASDTELAVPQEPASEMYYTASSEVSLLSDEVPAAEEGEPPKVIAGHVAAMRERFESMTRANTPCPDAMRSASPSLDVFRNVTPDPDDALA